MAEENIAVTRFREYLRVNTMQPKPDYAGCAAFLKGYAEELGLEYAAYEPVAGKPVVVLTWRGSDPTLGAILLNSHTDVVPVSRARWTQDPFAATKLPNGDIVARGSQDMKCVGIGYLEAIRILKSQGVVPVRTVHSSFVPDEEIGGTDGMKAFIQTADFKALNVDFALDEGISHPDDAYKVFYSERTPWWITLTAKGSAGHGSQFIEPNATARLIRVLNKFLALRESEQRRLALGLKLDGSKYTLGDVTSVNVTMLNAGVQANVVPEVAKASVDVRVAPTVNLVEFKKLIRGWCDEEEIELTGMMPDFSGSTAADSSNKWWNVLSAVASQRSVKLEPEVFPAGTDSRFLRAIGLPALGISPIRNTPILLHDHDEFLNENTFLEGVSFYVDLIKQLVRTQ
ncbi:uncharacterized protein BJ171DRAFT_505046 [Polychytrium aggregatum]|uniref:uncharacterized protein n=1 Tax=Polychytrium aggregatum TaxID=110093 RepID=UPI0022FE3E32|nr:uncharacterized protein BJ171DRAFT_505046 [Polychytrium aggregatum]KAI9204662.1 hypothetical protein BJ171DRAFT_505046 [Polychytrium aggregatum]